MRRVVLSPAAEARFRADWADPGLTMDQIAQRSGHVRDTLRRVAADLGLKARREHTSWSEDLIAEIVRRYGQGEFPAALAREKGMTRNQVVSKLRRLGVLRPARQAAPKPAPGPKAQTRRSPSAPRPQAPAKPKSATVLLLRPKPCCWPIGDPLEPDYTSCGAPAHGSYCPEHRAIAYQPSKPPKVSTDPLTMRARARFGS